MADSVGSFSEHGTSDELVDPYCDPCIKDGTMLQVAGYCPKCVEFYCQSCLGVHRRSSMTERHKILLGSDMPSCQADKPVKFQLCEKHDGELRDRYCFDHDSIICGICFVRKHKQCQVKHVSDACKSFSTTSEEKTFRHDVSLLLNHVKTINQSMKNNRKRLEKQKKEILKEAQEHRDKLVKQINQSYQDFSNEVTSLFKEHNNNLSASQSTVDKIVTNVDGMSHSLQQTETKKQNDQKRFLEFQHSAEQIHLCDDKIKLLDLKCVDIKCNFNMNIQPLVVTNSQLGKLSLQTSTFECGTEFPIIHCPHKRLRDESHRAASGSSGVVGRRTVLPVKLTRLDKINIKIDDDTNDCLITGLDITADGKLFLADSDNSRIKLFSPDGQLLSSLTLPEQPKNATVINKSEAAVSMVNKQIGIIGITDSGHLSLKRIITTEHFVHGITVYNNKLITICEADSVDETRSVQMIDMKGKILWTVTTDSAGKNLFDNPRFLTTRSGEDGDTVIETDMDRNTITVLDPRSGNVLQVRDAKGKTPHGVTVDDNGNIYVCYDSGEISVCSNYKEEENIILSGKECVTYPYVMVSDHREKEILISSRSPNIQFCDFIHRYKIN